MPIISLSISDSLLEKLDRVLEYRGYSSRSEALRDFIREIVVEAEWSRGTSEETIAVIMVLYDKSLHREPVYSLEHEYDDVIQTLMHMHLDESNCLEVFVAKGVSKRILEIVRKINQIKGVKQVKYLTTLAEV
ncbi:MAG: nickel-responsive transcriptional regulator NikR [Candidatus Freyarchaeota archaeon]|nr:nickel-responsive transcriptional regulator NikR [Candidatus Freyarchaeota archaeon]